MKSFALKIIFLCSVFPICLMTDAVFAASTKEFKIFASGHMTSYGLPDCQLTDIGCTVTNEGTVKGTHVGKGTFTQAVTVLWKSGSPNGSGGYCAPASGIITITASDKSTITAARVGTVCQVAGNITFNATYYITGGTKKFVGASGIGISTCSIDGAGNVLGFANGSLIK